MFAISSQMIIMAVLIASASLSTWKVASWKYGSEISQMEEARVQAALEAVRKNREIEMLQISYNGAVFERDAYQKRKTEIKIHTVETEVIRYVKSPEPKCDLPPDWVRIHNSALSNNRVSENADTSSGAVDSPGGATVADVIAISDDIALSVITNNYGKCTKNSDKLRSLQDWASNLSSVTRQ